MTKDGKFFSDEFSALSKEIKDAFYDIPFENSMFQNINFVVNQQLTPGRAYRALGLRISAKLRALDETYFNRKLEDVDIAELEEKKNNMTLSKYERQRAEIEIEKKLAFREHTDKLIHDAIFEVKTLHAAFKKFPRFTREQFESGEEAHFRTKLLNQMQGITGAQEALLSMENNSLIKELEQTLKTLESVDP